MTRQDDDEPVGVLDERSLEDSLERQLADDAESGSGSGSEPESGSGSVPATDAGTEPGAELQPETGAGPRYGHVHDHEHEDAYAHANLRGSDRIRPAPTVPAYFDDPGQSQELARHTSLGGMIAAGLRALRRFPLLVASMYLVQVALSAGAALVMGALLFRAFGARPTFDRAMSGDVGALLLCFRDPQLLSSLVWIGLGAVTLYGVVSWFMTAGLIAVLLDPPARRREVARWFGAGGAANFFPFLRLALWAAIPYAAIGFLLLQAIAYLLVAVESIPTPGGLALEALRALAVPLVAHWIVGAAVDLARVDLVRHPGLSGLRALLRGFQLLIRRPVVLLCTLGYAVVAVGATLGYAALAAGPAAAAGLGALVLLRQLCAAVRFAAHVGLVAGEVELSCTSLHSPRRRFVS